MIVFSYVLPELFHSAKPLLFSMFPKTMGGTETGTCTPELSLRRLKGLYRTYSKSLFFWQKKSSSRFDHLSEFCWVLRRSVWSDTYPKALPWKNKLGSSIFRSYDPDRGGGAQPWTGQKSKGIVAYWVSKNLVMPLIASTIVFMVPQCSNHNISVDTKVW